MVTDPSPGGTSPKRMHGSSSQALSQRGNSTPLGPIVSGLLITPASRQQSHAGGVRSEQGCEDDLANSGRDGVVVSSAAPVLQTQSASVRQVVSAQQINDLPLNGRNYYFLAQLAAGVTFGQIATRGEDNNGRFTALAPV